MSTSEETRTLAVLPIKNTVLYPYLLMPLSVARERSLAAIEAAVASEDKTLFVVAQKDPKVEDPAFEHLYTIGTEAARTGRQRHPDGSAGHPADGNHRRRANVAAPAGSLASPG
jgi:ATP-dependent Lon protease